MKIGNNTFTQRSYLTNMEHITYSEVATLLDKILSRSNKSEIIQGFKRSLITNSINGKYRGWSLMHLCMYLFDYTLSSAKSFIFADPDTFPALVKLIELLLDNNADLNIQDNSGRTPICFVSDADIIQILLKQGAQLNIHNGIVSSLHVLSSLANKNLIDHIRNGADPYIIDRFGRLPLHLAAAKDISSNCCNITALIHHAPFSIMAMDNFGHYPLFYALMFGSDAAVNILLAESPPLVIQDVIIQVERNELTEDKLIEQLALYDDIYSIDRVFKVYFGGAKRGKLKDRIDLAQEKIKVREYVSEKFLKDHGGRQFNSKSAKNFALNRDIKGFSTAVSPINQESFENDVRMGARIYEIFDELNGLLSEVTETIDMLNISDRFRKDKLKSMLNPLNLNTLNFSTTEKHKLTTADKNNSINRAVSEFNFAIKDGQLHHFDGIGCAENNKSNAKKEFELRVTNTEEVLNFLSEELNDNGKFARELGKEVAKFKRLRDDVKHMQFIERAYFK